MSRREPGGGVEARFTVLPPQEEGGAPRPGRRVAQPHADGARGLLDVPHGTGGAAWGGPRRDLPGAPGPPDRATVCLAPPGRGGGARFG